MGEPETCIGIQVSLSPRRREERQENPLSSELLAKKISPARVASVHDLPMGKVNTEKTLAVLASWW
jgi:hypothetical protein